MAVAAGICISNIYYNQPILKDIKASFGVGEREIGLVAILTQSGFGLGLFFVIPLGDKINRKKLILILQALLFASLIGISVMWSLTGVLVTSLLIGLSAVAAQVILPMAASLETKNRGKTVGIVFTGILIGVLSARVFSGFVAEHLGWRYVYWLSALFFFFICPPYLFSASRYIYSFHRQLRTVVEIHLATG
jgi:MFS family permease